MTDEGNQQRTFVKSLIAGGTAGLSVDVALFPIDTLKTRLQSKDGFKIWEPRLYRGMYRGLTSAAIGSVPGASLFFCTYDTSKRILGEEFGHDRPWVHMISAAMGETMACLARVPTDNVKQKMQMGMYDSVSKAFQGIRVQGPKPWSGFYVGYATTVMREIPFGFIQFPLWERLKALWSSKQQGIPLNPIQSAMCGSFSGAIAAAITTPIDVAKTRLMLLQVDANSTKKPGLMRAISDIYRTEGASGLFRGIGPRVMWISIGGSVFFGAYEQAYRMMR